MPILLCAGFMLDYILYQYTPGGQFALLEKPLSDNAELLGVVASEGGVFEVKGKGGKPAVSDYLLLPVKGSKQISLKMRVEDVQPLITPLGAWSARCEGPKQKEFNLKNIEACCDQCATQSELEFIAFSGDDRSDALAAMNLAGWEATLERQICPACKSNKKAEY